MMIDLCNRLVDNDLSREELLPRLSAQGYMVSEGPKGKLKNL